MSEIKVSKIKGKTGINGGKPNIASSITIGGLSLDSELSVVAPGEGSILDNTIINSNTLPDSAEVNRGNFWYNDSGATPTLSMLVNPEKNRWIEIATAPSAGSGAWYGDRAVHSLASNTPGALRYWSLSTHASATTFGELYNNTMRHGSLSDATYGLFSGFANDTDAIEYVTISTPGNGTSFGNLTFARYDMGGVCNGARGCWSGGYDTNYTTSGGGSVIDYVTTATPSNATDFGDMSVSRFHLSGCADSTRGLFAGGYDWNAGSISNIIDYITIDTPGNATDFGDMSVTRRFFGACSDDTYGVFAAGQSSSDTNVIDYVTIQTAGNATDFGDYYGGVRKYNAAVSNGTDGFAYGGTNAYGLNADISTFTISTPANATLFGAMGHTGNYQQGCSGNSA